MRFSAIAVSLLGAITSALAQSSPYPACANPCLANANTTGCVSTDIHCLCTDSTFISNTTTCIYGACNGTDLQNALKTAQEVCADVGVTLTSTPSGAATASPSSTAKSGASVINKSTFLGLGAAAVAAVAALCI